MVQTLPTTLRSCIHLVDYVLNMVRTRERKRTKEKEGDWVMSPLWEGSNPLSRNLVDWSIELHFDESRRAPCIVVFQPQFDELSDPSALLCLVS